MKSLLPYIIVSLAPIILLAVLSIVIGLPIGIIRGTFGKTESDGMISECIHWPLGIFSFCFPYFGSFSLLILVSMVLVSFFDSTGAIFSWVRNSIATYTWTEIFQGLFALIGAISAFLGGLVAIKTLRKKKDGKDDNQ